VKEAPSSEQTGATTKHTQGTKEANTVKGGDNGVGPIGSVSDRLMPFQRNDFASFRMPKRIFPSRARSEVPVSQTAQSERERPFSRNPASAFRLRKRLFVESTTAEEANGQVSSRARPFQRNHASAFQLRKRNFSPNSNRLARTGASSSVESVPTFVRVAFHSGAFFFANSLNCLSAPRAELNAASLSRAGTPRHSGCGRRCSHPRQAESGNLLAITNLP